MCNHHLSFSEQLFFVVVVVAVVAADNTVVDVVVVVVFDTVGDDYSLQILENYHKHDMNDLLTDLAKELSVVLQNYCFVLSLA